jgi:uncharacterized membrane protein
MTELEQQINKLQQQVYAYKQQQIQMFKELQQMETALERLQQQASQASVQSSELRQETSRIPQAAPVRPTEKYVHQVKQQLKEQTKKVPNVNTQWEDFIGTNVISKVGILITIIGIFIGAKYAIDNELISPAMRIIVGYIAGAGLVAVGLKLKEKYIGFSSILFGGGLAVLYFITFIAFDFYQLLPRAAAFVGMLVITAATVGAALWYNRKVIAVLGQVGAYGIPFLLSDGSGQVSVLFTYISIINIGLVFLSFKKDWKILYRLAFYVSWLIYAVWLIGGNTNVINFYAALVFLGINFAIFYSTFLCYKVYRKETFNLHEIIVLLLNALFFFFLGCYFISEHRTETTPLTLFALSNAALHFLVGLAIQRLKLFDRSVGQFVIALALLFITIAIPMQLDGNWVTLLWAFEGTLLYMIAQRNNRPLYLHIAMPVFMIALLSLLQDWWQAYPYLLRYDSVAYTRNAFANLNFWLQMIVAGLFGFIAFRHAASKVEDAKGITDDFFRQVVPVIFIVLLYFNIYHEIHYAWDKMIAATSKETEVSTAGLCQSLSLIIYSCVYFSIMLMVNTSVVKRNRLHQLFIVAAFITNIVVLLRGLYLLGELREELLKATSSAHGDIYLYRYLVFGALAFLWMNAYRSIKRFSDPLKFQPMLSVMFNVTILSLTCSEFVHWMDIAGYSNQYKLGLTIICALYALGLLAAGIAKKRKHLRVQAIILFGATIIKLFIYDLASLSTISKTIVLVILGVLLLIASFLYNKYKDLLFEKEEPPVAGT